MKSPIPKLTITIIDYLEPKDLDERAYKQCEDGP